MPVRYRRSPHIVCYWEEGRLVYENYARHMRVAAAPLACEVLDFFGDWRLAGELSQRFPMPDAAPIAKAIADLLDAGLLERSDGSDPHAEAFASWSTWTPAASFFHFSTKDAHGRMVPAATMRRLRRRARKVPMPPATKRYRNVPLVHLPRPDTSRAFTCAPRAANLADVFAAAPVSADAATLLGLTWGFRSGSRSRGLGPTPMKTSPSGGSRHPIEAYVFALHVDGLPRGSLSL